MPKPPRELTVSEERDYVADSGGPVQDTDVFSRGEEDVQPDRPAHIDAGPRNQRPDKPEDPLKGLRKQASRHTTPVVDRRTPRWLALAMGLATAGIVAATVVVFVGVFLAGAFGDGDAPDAVPDVPVTPAPEELPDEIDGVEVRRGLKGSSGDRELPPKKREP